MSKPLNVIEFIDESPISRFQKLVAGLAFAILAIDGFDTAAVGFIAPSLRSHFGVEASALSPLLAAGFVGLLFGALFAGPIADRVGRKPVLIGSLIVFGLASLGAAFAPDLFWLTGMRLITGLGLGGAFPNAVTLASEYFPERRRSDSPDRGLARPAGHRRRGASGSCGHRNPRAARIRSVHGLVAGH